MSGHDPFSHLPQGSRPQGNDYTGDLTGASVGGSAVNTGVDRPAGQRALALTTTRPLGERDLDAAESLFRKAAGWEYYAPAFRRDAEKFITNSPSAVYGAFDTNGALVATGIVIKAGFAPTAWSVTWVMVDASLQGQGYGQQIMTALLDHAKQHQSQTENPNCLVLLSAVDESAARFYERKVGFKTLADGPLPNGERLMYRHVTGPGLPIAGEVVEPRPGPDRIEHSLSGAIASSAVRQLSGDELLCALRLLESSPAYAGYSLELRYQIAKSVRESPSAMYGAFSSTGELLGAGVLLREPFDFAYWSVAAIAVVPQAQGAGCGEKIYKEMCEHALRHHEKIRNPNTRFLVCAAGQQAAFYYRTLGFSMPIDDPGLRESGLLFSEVRGPGLNLRPVEGGYT